jgi:hypothetical protein
LLASLLVFTQRLPHLWKSFLQVKSHVPALQIAVALGTVVVQTLPQVPQLFGSVLVLTQTPLPVPQTT